MNTLHLKSFIKIVGLVALLSTLGNIVLTYIGWRVSTPPETFGPYDYLTVIALTVLGVFAAALVYYAMYRWCKTDVATINRRFFIISIIALVVSFIPDIMMPWSTDADQIGWTYGIIVNLMLMHVVAAVFVLYFFPKTSRS